MVRLRAILQTFSGIFVGARRARILVATSHARTPRHNATDSAAGAEAPPVVVVDGAHRAEICGPTATHRAAAGGIEGDLGRAHPRNRESGVT